MSFACVDDFERKAEEVLEKNTVQFYQSGAGEEFTLNLNREAFKRLRIRPRYMRDVSNLDLSCSILGQSQKWPVGIAPSAMQKLAHPEGEIANAKAAGEMGSIFILSNFSTITIEDVAAAAPDTTKWLQLNLYKDRDISAGLVRRAENAGFKAIVLTIDNPVFGERRVKIRNKTEFSSHLTFANFQGIGDIDSNPFAIVENLEAAMSWEVITWLKKQTTLPIIVKGVMTREDAVLAREFGCAGIIVSNHGARHLDTVAATIEVLPEVVKAVGHDMLVMMDGGVRQGIDIFKAYALGAKYVFVGRPAIWGLCCNGQKGVEDVLKMLQKELEIAMALSGCSRLGDICKGMVVHESYYAKLLD